MRVIRILMLCILILMLFILTLMLFILMLMLINVDVMSHVLSAAAQVRLLRQVLYDNTRAKVLVTSLVIAS